MIGFQGLSYTVLNYRVGARGRLAGLIDGLVCLAVLLAGASLFAYIPKSLLGGLLLFLGLGFLNEWVVQGYKRLRRADYAVVLLMLVVIAFSDFVVGVGVGLVVMLVSFVVNYSRSNIFHHTLTGAEVSSSVQRDVNLQRKLVGLGKQIYILELQGFIFFGTANAVLEQVRTRLESTEEGALLFLMLDFRRVTGLDSSAVFSLTKVKDLADMHDFTLVLTHLSEAAQHELMGYGLAVDKRTLFFDDVDHGLEWCEEQLLSRNPVMTKLVPFVLEAQLEARGFEKDEAARLKPYLKRQQLKPGEYLIHQGDTLRDLYFIVLGQVSVYLEMGDGKQVRVRTSGAGTVVGELSFYMDLPRSASVIADINTLAYRLTQSAMAELKVKDPELATAFNELMLRVIAEQLTANIRTLTALNR
jgi:SulP family sulfate permease